MITAVNAFTGTGYRFINAVVSGDENRIKREEAKQKKLHEIGKRANDKFLVPDFLAYIML